MGKFNSFTRILVIAAATMSSSCYELISNNAQLGVSSSSNTLPPITLTAPPGTRMKLVFATQPAATAVSGVALTTQPVVNIVDSTSGAIVATATNSINLTAYTNSTCSTPSSGSVTATTLPLPAVSGVATFAGVALTKAETVYLKASTVGLLSACSSVGIVVSVGPASKLTFSTQPSSTGQLGAPLIVQPVVQITDLGNNLITAAVNPVQLTPYSDSACTTTPVAAPGGGSYFFANGSFLVATTNPVTAVAGVATFSGTKYNQAGAIYIKATSAGLASACSNLVTISVPPKVTSNAGAYISFPGVGSDPTSMITADIDGDGKPDLIVSYPSEKQVAIFLNTSGVGSSPSFASPFLLSSASPDLQDLVAADFDGDGKLDIAAMHNPDTHIDVWRNMSTPGHIIFSNSVLSWVVGGGSGLDSLAVADMNQDGKPELIVTSWTNPQETFQNTSAVGTIQFNTATPFQQTESRANFASDIDGDGIPDWIFGNLGGGSNDGLQIILNPNNGTLSAGAASAVQGNGADCYSIKTADFDGNGKTDVVTGCVNGNLNWFRNTSTLGTPSMAAAYSSVTTPGIKRFLTVGDFNGDGIPDTASTDENGRVLVYINNSSPGTFSMASAQAFLTATTTGGNFGVVLTSADVNSDGGQDIIFGVAGQSAIYIINAQ